MRDQLLAGSGGRRLTTGLLLGTLLTAGVACSSKAEGSGSLGVGDSSSKSTGSTSPDRPAQPPTSPTTHRTLSLPTNSAAPVGNEAKTLPAKCDAIGSTPSGATLHQQNNQTDSGQTLTCTWNLPPEEGRPALAVVLSTQLFVSHDGVPGAQVAQQLATRLLVGGGPIEVPGADEAQTKAVIGPQNAKVTTVDLVARKMNVVIDIRGQNYGGSPDTAKKAAAVLAADALKAVQFG